ncbi:MAG TPA: PadR family transcriptional regulator [Vicinamibacterales bacterium]|nr:PadR family transcriptional regulator [Vicinamibacterales bacterium]
MSPKNEPPRLTYSGLKVLRAFLETFFHEGVRAQLAGADIMRRASISSGTMYPLLYRFEDAGLLEGAWETKSATDLGRPQRRLYRLTAEGAAFARRALETVSPSTVPQMGSR